MLLNQDDSQLVLVDYQNKGMGDIFKGELVLANAVCLAKIAKLLHLPVLGTEHQSEQLGGTADALSGLLSRTLKKTFFSAAEEGLVECLRPKHKPEGGNARSLPKHLQKAVSQILERNTVVIAGCEAHISLLQTALDLMAQEFDVWVVTDACSSRTERSRDAAFDRLAGAGAELVTTEMVAFEWLRSSEHEAFRQVLDFLK